MDLIKLLDVSSPKNIKNVINTLIREYENVAENFPTKLSDLTDDETHRLVTDTEKASWNAKLSAIPNDYKTKTENDNLYQPKGDYLTSFTETDPTVPDWAKAATKPSYNYSEINNTPTIPTVNNSTIIIKQGEETKGTFTLNQSNDSIIELDVGGGGSGSNVTLYEGLGQNTDGAMTQKAVTDELQKFKVIDVNLRSSSSMDAYYTVDLNYADLVKEGTELVIRFDKKPTYVVPVYLMDKNGSVCQIYQQSSLDTYYKANYVNFASDTWSVGDLIRIKYTESITKNTGTKVSGFVAIENISSSYYYGTANTTFNALNDEYGNRIYTTYLKKSELSLDGYVTINTAQTITGNKTLTGVLLVPDVTID